jgi:hypothetical protein
MLKNILEHKVEVSKKTLKPLNIEGNQSFYPWND